MWKLFFEICYFSCALIPSRRVRERLRTKQLFDWYNKYNALRKKFPELNFRHTRMIKGGWNIGFIVDKKYVFKIRKHFDSSIPADKITREKRITDAFQTISPIHIPKIEIVQADEYTFYKYDFIPGKNLNFFSQRTIEKHAWEWGKQLAEFIYAVHNSRPTAIEDLRENKTGDGWNHNDICNNVIVDKKTMKISGLIDWEYAGWGLLETEFRNTAAFSKKVRDSGLQIAIMSYYKSMTETTEENK